MFLELPKLLMLSMHTPPENQQSYDFGMEYNINNQFSIMNKHGMPFGYGFKPQYFFSTAILTSSLTNRKMGKVLKFHFCQALELTI